MAPKYAPDGRYIRVKGVESGIYLTVQGESKAPGTQVVIQQDIEGRSPSQIWYEDKVTGTIRSKNNHLCITANDDGLIILDDYQRLESQKWQVDEAAGLIRNSVNGSVLDVADHNTISGSPIIANAPTGEDNQKWTFFKSRNEYFTIVSEFSELCLEAESKMMGGCKAGARILMGPKDQKDNQLWYEDENGIIRSKVKDMGLSCEMEQGSQMRLDEYDESNPAMQWVYLANNTIATKSLLTNVLDIEAQNKSKGAKVIVWQSLGHENQKWRLEYYSKKKKSSKDDASDEDEDE